MILEVRVRNFMAYAEEVRFSVCADMRIKKFPSCVHGEGGYNALKSVCVVGANNSGKTCLVKAFDTVRRVLMNDGIGITLNAFTGSSVCAVGVTFVEDGRVFSYDFRYDCSEEDGFVRGFVYECFKEHFVDRYGNRSEKTIFMRDVDEDEYVFNGGDESVGRILSLCATGNIAIYLVDGDAHPAMGECRRILRKFASGMDVLDAGAPPMDKTLSALERGGHEGDAVAEFIRKADLGIEDVDVLSGGFSSSGRKKNSASGDVSRLVTVHGGERFRGSSVESYGTLTAMALAGYVVDALRNGRTLVADELDCGHHVGLVKEIVSLFNNEKNSCAQLLFTAHDTALLDCKTLFRKDQIRFAERDGVGKRLYSLSDFNCADDGVRSDSDVRERYLRGDFGAVPVLDLSSVLYPEDGGEASSEGEPATESSW